MSEEVRAWVASCDLSRKTCWFSRCRSRGGRRAEEREHGKLAEFDGASNRYLPGTVQTIRL